MTREQSKTPGGFESFCPVSVDQDPLGWLIAHMMRYHSRLTGKVHEIDEETNSDLASIPGIVLWLLRPWRVIDPAIASAVMHDDCYRVRIPAGEMTYREADREFRDSLEMEGVDGFSRWSMWTAVRLAGLFRGRAGRAGWWGDAPRVIPMTVLLLVLASPSVFLLPPMLVIAGLKRVSPGRPRQIYQGPAHLDVPPS